MIYAEGCANPTRVFPQWEPAYIVKQSEDGYYVDFVNNKLPRAFVPFDKVHGGPNPIPEKKE